MTAPRSGAWWRAGGPPVRLHRRRMALAAAVAATVAVALAWVVLGSGLLAVRSVRLAGVVPVPTARVLAAAGIRLGTPLIRVNTAQVARRVEQITQVQSATVRRSWPNAIVIWIRPRTPVLAVPGQGGYTVIDAYGVRLGWSARRPAGLAVLQPAAGSAPALRGSPSVQAAGRVLAGLPGPLRRLVVAVRSLAGGVTLELRGGITVIWGGPDRAAAKASELTALLRTRARRLDVSDPGTAVAGG